MINNFFNWIHKHALALFVIALVCTCLSTLYSLIDITRKPPDIGDAKGVQHHLVWDISGNCFFVRPYTATTNYLISVPDCNKGK